MAAAAGAADLASPAELAGDARKRGSSPRRTWPSASCSGDAACGSSICGRRRPIEQFHIPTARRVDARRAGRRAARRARTPTSCCTETAGPRCSTRVRVLRTGGSIETCCVLREGVSEWLGRVHEPRLAVDATPAERARVRARRGAEPLLRRRAAGRCAAQRSAAGLLDGQRHAATSCWSQRRCSRSPRSGGADADARRRGLRGAAPPRVLAARRHRAAPTWTTPARRSTPSRWSGAMRRRLLRQRAAAIRTPRARPSLASTDVARGSTAR